MKALFVGLLLASPAQATDVVEVSGFVRPRLELMVRPDAVPADRLRAGFGASNAGLVVSGQPADEWQYKVYLRLQSESVQAITGVRTIDRDNDGFVDGVSTNSASVAKQLLREVTATWTPTPLLAIKMGHMPIPFTSAAQSPDTALLFPDRAGPNQTFVADDDLGAVLKLRYEDYVVAQAGVFNGTGVGASSSRNRGLLYMARVDVNPLGEFDFDESKAGRDDIRLGIGAGLAWNPYTAFDRAGFANVAVSDLRASVSLRFAIRDVTVAAEGLRRFQVDSLTQRPIAAYGYYGQVSWRAPLGIEPIARYGETTDSESFDPQLVRWMDAGLNWYPYFDRDSRPDAVKVTLQYVQEDRVTELERARGVSTQVQVTFD